MGRTALFALAAFLGLLALGLAVQVPLIYTEGVEALRAAESDSGVMRLVEVKVGPLLRQGKSIPVVVYLDPASPPSARVYVVEWLNPDSLYFTALVKVKVRAVNRTYEVLSVEA
ncbi:MAG: hypothetical protein DRJ97_02980 [Thermoprotei archaeon]|nr:MAG: hypothetical protein DRJ97_02980 [Thermoprotei archaeon]